LIANVASPARRRSGGRLRTCERRERRLWPASGGVRRLADAGSKSALCRTYRSVPRRIDKRPRNPLACNVSVYFRTVDHQADAPTVNYSSRAVGHPYCEHLLGPAHTRRRAGSRRAESRRGDRQVRVGGLCRSTDSYLGRPSQPLDGRSGGGHRACSSSSACAGLPGKWGAAVTWGRSTPNPSERTSSHARGRPKEDDRPGVSQPS
jgi:hypothetical protein